MYLVGLCTCIMYLANMHGRFIDKHMVCVDMYNVFVHMHNIVSKHARCTCTHVHCILLYDMFADMYCGFVDLSKFTL